MKKQKIISENWHKELVDLIEKFRASQPKAWSYSHLSLKACGNSRTIPNLIKGGDCMCKTAVIIEDWLRKHINEGK